MKIEFWNDCDALDILYQQGFRQAVYINTVLSNPSYNIFQGEFDKWKKVYGFDLIAPEYLVDALMTLPMHDNVLIDGILVRNIEVSVEWLIRWGRVRVTFDVGYYVNSGCGNMNFAPIYTSAPPGQCFSPDTIVKGIVTEYGTSDGIWLLADEQGAGYVRGLVYQRLDGQTNEYPIAEGQGILDFSTGVEYYYNGDVFHRYPYITAIEQVGASSYRIAGFVFPETFAYLYYRQYGSVGAWTAVDPITSGEFMTSGVTVNTVVADDYEWYLESKHFSCDYGDTPPQTYWTGYILLNDFGEYIVQNDENDRLYR